MNQLYIYIYAHIPPSCVSLPQSLSHPSRWTQNTDLILVYTCTMYRCTPVLCGCFPLATYFTFGSVYMSIPLFHFVPAYPSPSPCPQVHSLRLSLYSCPDPRFFRTTFFFIPYICVSVRYLFFSF